ncbi:MAG TPA: hypothetical protein VH916_02495 [Dehalococcoidia bacterium]|jgi:hypothetical protein
MGLTYRLTQRQLTDDEIDRRLRFHEEQAGMSSEEFLNRYNSGELGHLDAFIDWAGLLAVKARVAVSKKATV